MDDFIQYISAGKPQLIVLFLYFLMFADKIVQVIAPQDIFTAFYIWSK